MTTFEKKNGNGLEEEWQWLFAMVWGSPTTEVAKGSGISDLVLSKRCLCLQVPERPRG